MRGAFVKDALRDLTEKAARSSVVINTVDTKGVTISGMLEARDDPGKNDTTAIADARIKGENELNEGLAYIAGATGGSFIHGNNFLAPAILKVLDKQTSYYLVGYEPDSETFTGKRFHNIAVKTTRPELLVSSRDGFFGQIEADSRPVLKSADSPLYQAMDSPLQDTGMEIGLTVLHGNSASGGDFIRPLFHIKGEDITFSDDRDGGKKVVLDVVRVTLDEKGRLADEFNRTYTTHIPKEAVDLARQNGLDFSGDMLIKRPGVYSFRIAVRDEISKRLGSAGDYFEIDDIKKGKFAVGGLITTGVDTTGLPALSKPRPIESAFSLVPDLSVPSIRKYKRGSQLFYTYTVYNAKIDPASGSPNMTRQVRLFHNGKIMSSGSETPFPDGVPSDTLRINDLGSIRITDQVEAGEYALQIVVRDKLAKKVASQWIDFEVVD